MTGTRLLGLDHRGSHDSMTDKKTPSDSARRGRADSTAGVKQQLTQLNRDIIRLCNERQRLISRIDPSSKLAQWLQTHPFEEQLQKRPANAQGPLKREHLRAIFRELESATRSLVDVDRVAFLGPEFSYSHLAAIHQFGQCGELIPISTIAGVFESVERGDAKLGVVPIENSTDGRIVDTLDRFVRSSVRICGELPMPIHHNLLGLGTLSRSTRSSKQAASPFAVSQLARPAFA